MPVVIPELVYVVGLFFAVVGYLAARGLLATWTHTLGYLLEALAGALVFSIPLTFGHKKIDLGGPVRALDHAIITAIQNWADGAEIEMGYCLHGLEKIGRFMAQAIDLLARETAATFEWMLHAHLPRWVKVIGTVAFPWPAVYRAIRGEIAKALPHIRTEIHTVTHDVPRVIVKVIHQTVAVAHAPAIAIPRIWRGIDDVETDIRKLMKRAARVEALFGATAMALAMANVLGVSARCLRSGNVGKAARHLCGLPTHWLEDVLGLLADFFILENVCTVLPWVEAAASEVAVPLVEALTVVGAGLCGGTIGIAAPLEGPTAQVPPVTFAASLAA